MQISQKNTFKSLSREMKKKNYIFIYSSCLLKDEEEKSEKYLMHVNQLVRTKKKHKKVNENPKKNSKNCNLSNFIVDVYKE
jgi:hypothetical protein